MSWGQKNTKKKKIVKFDWEAFQLSPGLGKLELVLLTVVACASDVRQANKLVEGFIASLGM